MKINKKNNYIRVTDFYDLMINYGEYKERKIKSLNQINQINHSSDSGNLMGNKIIQK